MNEDASPYMRSSQLILTRGGGTTEALNYVFHWIFPNGGADVGANV
jgi:hypothetical protein